MAFLDEAGLETFLSYVKAWSRTQFIPVAYKNRLDNIGAVFRFKGKVSTPASLPSSGNAAGDVYAVETPASVWVWNGSAWVDLGFGDALVPAAAAQIDSLF